MGEKEQRRNLAEHGGQFGILGQTHVRSQLLPAPRVSRRVQRLVLRVRDPDSTYACTEAGAFPMARDAIAVTPTMRVRTASAPVQCTWEIRASIRPRIFAPYLGPVPASGCRSASTIGLCKRQMRQQSDCASAKLPDEPHPGRKGAVRVRPPSERSEPSASQLSMAPGGRPPGSPTVETIRVALSVRPPIPKAPQFVSRFSEGATTVNGRILLEFPTIANALRRTKFLAKRATHSLPGAPSTSSTRLSYLVAPRHLWPFLAEREGGSGLSS